LVSINVEREKAKYEAELNSFTSQLQQLEQHRAALVQAIAERQGILAYLNSLNHKEKTND
jgi:prefoldin subunit 5